SVTITAPAAGSPLAGTAGVAASAADDVGVTRVEFLLDGSIASTDTAASWAWSWDTIAASNGAHTLTAAAYDAAGNRAVSPAVGVTVNNGAPDTTAPTVP